MKLDILPKHESKQRQKGATMKGKRTWNPTSRKYLNHSLIESDWGLIHSYTGNMKLLTLIKSLILESISGKKWNTNCNNLNNKNKNFRPIKTYN